MNKILLIAGRTISENIRLKTFIYLAFMIVSTILLFRIEFVSSYSANFLDLRVLEAVAVGKFFMWGYVWIVGIPFLIFLAFLVANAVSGEVNSGVAMLIFTRPVRRYEFVVGKFLGLWAFASLLNVWILLLIPGIENLLGGVRGAVIPAMYEMAAVLIAYSILLSGFVIALGVLLSAKNRKALVSLLILFVLLILAYFAPMVNVVAGTDLPYATKPFVSVAGSLVSAAGLHPHPNAADTVGMLSDAYFVYKPFVIETFVNPLVVVLLVVLAVLFVLLGCWFLQRQDIA